MKNFNRNVTPVTTPGIYHNPDLGLISLSSDGTNWITIADKNLGATQVYNSGDALSEVNCGKYFQRGNNYGFPFTGSVTTSSSQVNASTYGPGNYYSSSTFITGNQDWSSVQNDNLWGNTTNTNEARRGPCAEGYHVPTGDEFENLVNAGITLGAWATKGYNEFKTYLKMPLAGARASTGDVSLQDTQGKYSTSSIGANVQTSYRTFSINTGGMKNSDTYRTQADSIRPFANTPVQPDDSWTVLYQ